LTNLISLIISITIFILTDTGLVLETVFGGRDDLNSTKYCFSFKWRSEGTANGQFLRPHDVSFDSKGDVYVSDRDRNDIQKFRPNGTFIMKWGSEGDKAGQFNVPHSIEIDPLDNIYVVDSGNDRIQKISWKWYLYR
jgi:DNA-binding beta-propeller fold protein YncE